MSRRGRRAKILFVNEREAVATPVYVAYSSEPWTVLGHLELVSSNLREAAPQLPPRLVALADVLLGEGVCHAIGVTNTVISGDTCGVLYLRPIRGQEDNIIPQLRKLTRRAIADDPVRPQGFDQDDLMAELLTIHLYPPQP